MEKFGSTLLFVICIFLIIIGLKMAIKVADPVTRKLSPSLADALQAA